MKKFMKGCAVTALILIVIGFLLATVAGSVKGRTTISEVVESVTGGRVHINPYGFWGAYVSDTIEEGVEAVEGMDYQIEESMGFNKDYKILDGNIERYSLGSDIRRLDIEVGACRFTTELSPDDNFYLEAKYAGKFQGYVEDETLYIRSSVTGKKWSVIDRCQITLYIPEGVSFDSADIEVGAGLLEFDRLTADEVELEVGAGQITLNHLQVGNLEVSVGMGQIVLKEMIVDMLEAEVGMGEFTAEGIINGDTSVECSMGNVALKLTGSQEDFNYELSKAMGNVTLGTESNSGFASEKSIDNGADKTMDIECSMGNVSIRYKLP